MRHVTLINYKCPRFERNMCCRAATQRRRHSPWIRGICCKQTWMTHVTRMSKMCLAYERDMCRHAATQWMRYSPWIREIFHVFCLGVCTYQRNLSFHRCRCVKSHIWVVWSGDTWNLALFCFEVSTSHVMYE